MSSGVLSRQSDSNDPEVVPEPIPTLTKKAKKEKKEKKLKKDKKIIGSEDGNPVKKKKKKKKLSTPSEFDPPNDVTLTPRSHDWMTFGQREKETARDLMEHQMHVSLASQQRGVPVTQPLGEWRKPSEQTLGVASHSSWITPLPPTATQQLGPTKAATSEAASAFATEFAVIDQMNSDITYTDRKTPTGTPGSSTCSWGFDANGTQKKASSPAVSLSPAPESSAASRGSEDCKEEETEHDNLFQTEDDTNQSLWEGNDSVGSSISDITMGTIQKNHLRSLQQRLEEAQEVEKPQQQKQQQQRQQFRVDNMQQKSQHKNIKTAPWQPMANPKDAIMEEYEYDEVLERQQLELDAQQQQAPKELEKWEHCYEEDYVSAVNQMHPRPQYKHDSYNAKPTTNERFLGAPQNRRYSSAPPIGRQAGPSYEQEGSHRGSNDGGNVADEGIPDLSPSGRSRRSLEPLGPSLVLGNRRGSAEADAVITHRHKDAGTGSSMSAAEAEKDHELLIMYMLSMGIDPVTANNLADSFAEQKASAGVGNSVDMSKNPDNLEKGTIAAMEDEGEEWADQEWDPAIVKALDAMGNDIMAAEAKTGFESTRRPDYHAQTRRGPNWERFEAPGAVQMEGRAYGARYRPPSAQAGRSTVSPMGRSQTVRGGTILDVEMGEGSSPFPSHLVEAKAVEELEMMFGLAGPGVDNVVLADATPLSLKHFWKEQSVRRMFLVVFVLVMAVIVSVTVVFLKKAKDVEAAAHKALGVPTLSPSSTPTRIESDYISALSGLSGASLLEDGSPQRRAVAWLSTFDNAVVEVDDPRFEQRYILAVLYYATSGDTWLNAANWLNPDLHECDWGTDTIVCEQDPSLRRLVTKIDLSRVGLVGTVPIELGSLSIVVELKLSRNALFGTIPSELFGLSELTTLEMSGNKFTGKIPSSINNSRDLEQIDLSNNRLTGSLPGEMYDLGSLRILNINTNLITGSISSGLGRLTILNTLNMRMNRISGTVPDTFDYIPKLDFILLDDNRLTGTIPPWSSAAVGRQELSIARNLLTGTLPSIYSDLGNIRLKRVDASSNFFTGTIPFVVSVVPTLQYLDLSNNSLTGTFPAFGGGQWGGIETLLMSDNQINGPVPVAFPDSLKQLDFRNNQLQFGIPIELSNFPNLAILDLRNNDLGGGIHTEFGNMSSLVQLHLANCSLDGTIPLELTELNVEDLDLGHNRLVGSIPVQLGQVATFKKIQLESNLLTGTIPSELGLLEKLDVLTLADNPGLTGRIPASFANLNNLKEFTVANTGLTGTVPEGICSNIPTLGAQEIGCGGIQCTCCTDKADLCIII
jgi:Leucine-rich repeat (LRR) protein